MSGGNDRGGYWRVLLCARCNALCVCPSVSFSLGEGVGDRKWQGSRDGKCMSWRTWWGNKASQSGHGCGPQRRVGVCLESLGPRRPSTPPHTPSRGQNIRAEGRRMEEVQRETYRGGRERLAGCQMLRCSEARCHTPARSLVPPSSKLFLFRPPSPFLLRYLLCIYQTNPCLWCPLPSLLC